ncbi:MAG: hypothetical protein GY930_22475 [bacterium]|nr:hypothetical protein [bacterium]
MEPKPTNPINGWRIRQALTLGVFCLGSALGFAQEAVEPVEVGQQEEQATGFMAAEPVYHNLEQVRELLGQWVEFGGDHVNWVDSLGGALAIEFGAGDLDLQPLRNRRTVLLVGGLDGRSVAGTEAVLHAGSRLLQGLQTLRPDLCFLLVPCASADGLALVDNGQGRGGRDLDGDGLVLQMLVEDKLGSWTPSLDARFMIRAKAGDTPRYAILPEGATEGDAGPITDLEHHFPLVSRRGVGGGWKQQCVGTQGVPHALRQYLLNRQNALVLSFQGNHGGLAYPGASANPPWEELPEAGLYQHLAQAFRKATGRTHAPAQSLLQARGGVEKGSFIDWCYSVPGVMAVEIAPWGMGGDHAGAELQPLTTAQNVWDFRPPMDESARRWAYWLDNERGGMGFAEWRPVVLPSGETHLVGGWKPRTFWNPPEDELATALKGLDVFVGELVEHLPYLELCDVSVRREGELCRVSARLRCMGAIPLQPQSHGLWGGAGRDGDAWLNVQVPGVMQLIAGPERSEFSDLSPGARSEPVNWLLHAPEGARLGVSFGLNGLQLGLQELSL